MGVFILMLLFSCLDAGYLYDAKVREPCDQLLNYQVAVAEQDECKAYLSSSLVKR